MGWTIEFFPLYLAVSVNSLGCAGVLNFVPIHAPLDCIIMAALTPTQYKTAKIHRIEHTPELNELL